MREFMPDVDSREAWSRRRLALLSHFQGGQSSETSWSDVGRTWMEAIKGDPCGIAFSFVYRRDALQSRLSLVTAVGNVEGQPAAPATMPLEGNGIWPTGEVLRTRVLRRLTGLDSAPVTVFVVPLVAGDADGVLIVGLDTATVFDPETPQFLTLLAGQISAHVAHAVLAFNRSTFQTLASKAPAAIFVKDSEGRYLFANSLTCAMLESDELIGLTDREVLPAETAARLFDQDRQVKADFKPVQREIRIGDRTYLLVKFPWCSPDVTGVALCGAGIDVTERKRIEAALWRTEKKYRAIGESINYGVWVCDATGRNMFASESFLALTGLSQQQCSDVGLASVLHPDEADETMRAWRFCVDSGTFWSREHRIKGVDGRYYHILARGVPVRNDTGAIERWVGINLDIHQIKEAEQQLREADRRNDQFLAMLAHELRNPLVPIRNSLHLMHAAGLATSTQRDAHEMMTRQVDNLVRLVSDMLDLGRIAAGKLALRTRHVDVASLIEAALEIARPHIDQMSQEVVMQLPEEPVWLIADPDRLTQVISSLLINSATYTPARGRLELSVQHRTDTLEVTISDSGVAPLPELHRSAADTVALYQDGVRLTENVGVGLALVKDLVEMHGGEVVFERPAGVTGTVGIRLPLPGAAIQQTSSVAAGG